MPVTDKELLDAVFRHTPAGTTEVAETVGISRQGVDARLKNLEASGEIWSKMVGPTKVWMHPDHLGSDLSP